MIATFFKKFVSKILRRKNKIGVDGKLPVFIPDRLSSMPIRLEDLQHLFGSYSHMCLTMTAKVNKLASRGQLKYVSTTASLYSRTASIEPKACFVDEHAFYFNNRGAAFSIEDRTLIPMLKKFVVRYTRYRTRMEQLGGAIDIVTRGHH